MSVIKVIGSLVAEVPEFIPHLGHQVGFNNKKYVVGDLCRKASLEWSRPMNATPDSTVWQALAVAGILEHARERLQGSTAHVIDMGVVFGCPINHIKTFQQNYPEFLQGRFEIEVPDAPPFRVNISKWTFVPECAAHALAYSSKLKDHCLVISIGFGTVELGAADQNGVFKQTLESMNYGLHQACGIWRKHLISLGFDEPTVRDDQYHYWDTLLKRVIDKDEDLVLRFNGKSFTWKELYDAANLTLQEYTSKLIPRIRTYLEAFDGRHMTILGGGGINHGPVYEGLRSLLEEMHFKIIRADKLKSVASGAVGYMRVAEKLYGKIAVGIDVGNNSVITVLNDKQ